MHIALPIGITWIAAVILALLDGRRRSVGWLAVGTLIAAMAAMIALALEVEREGTQTLVAGGWPVGVGIVLKADMLGITFAILSLTVLIAALTFEVLAGVRTSSFPALVIFLAAGLTGLFLTADAFNFYVFFEIAMIAAYVLAGYGEEPRQLRSATVFAVVNLLGSAFFLIAIASLYHLTGRLYMEGIAIRVAVFPSEAVILSAALLLIAFSIKLGLFPFHFWLPAVYIGTRPAVAAILSGAVANIGSYGLLRFGGEVLPGELELAAPVLAGLGVASIIYGSLQAISRRSIGEVLAYSSIGQVGYILIGLAIGGPVGYAAVVLFAIVNSLNKTLLFLAINLRGWLVGFAFVVGAFSVAGLPPAGGYIGKTGMFRAAISDDSWATVALIVLGSALSFVYMFQIFQRRFWIPPETPGQQPLAGSSPIELRVVVVILAIIVMVVGLWPEPLLSLSERAAEAVPLGEP
jgi:multicomponent Na+:H+ antiporter subunit D